jgi:hypothetical protein
MKEPLHANGDGSWMELTFTLKQELYENGFVKIPGVVPKLTERLSHENKPHPAQPHIDGMYTPTNAALDAKHLDAPALMRGIV